MKITLVMLMFLSVNVYANSYESTEAVSLKESVPESLLKGPNHELAMEVTSNGFQNSYKVKSEYGDFNAVGGVDLKVKIREVDALTYLDTLSKSDVFISSLKDAGIGTVKNIATAFTKPVQTVKGLPAGIGKLLTGFVNSTKRVAGATKRYVEGSENDPKELKKMNYNMSEAVREWSADLNVDPYSTNIKLRQAISSMAVVQFIGGLPIGLAIPVAGNLAVGVLEEVGGKLYKQDAASLELENRACLANLEAFSADDFFEADYMTPTMHTLFCSATQKLMGVKNTNRFSQELVSAESFAESRYILSTLSLYAWYHTHEAPITTFEATGGLPYALLENQELLMMMPSDFLLWTQSVANSLANISNNTEYDVKSIWLIGAASDLANTALKSEHWTLHDRNSDENMRQLFSAGLSGNP